MTRLFKTGTVARQVGITAPLLRMWQSRYALVEPTRGPGGQRLYTTDDITFLTAVRSLVDQGYAIGELASWSRRDLMRSAGGRPAPRQASAEIVFTLARDGRVELVSPNVEPVLGWAHGLLVGHPIWGVFLDVPPALVELVAGEKKLEEPQTFWVWLRARSGKATPCRAVLAMQRRSLTMTISPLAASGQDALSHLLTSLERARTGPLPSPEMLLRNWSERAIEQGAALARAWIYHPADASLRLLASAGITRAVHTSSRSVIRLSSYPFKVGVVARTGIPYLHNGLVDDRDFDAQWVKKERLESAACFPLAANGQLLGVTVEFFRRKLTPEDIGRLQSSAAVQSALLDEIRPVLPR